MATISSLGAGSGLDLESMISKLMAVEARPLTLLATKEASYQAKISAYGSIKGALSSLQTVAKTLADADIYTGMAATSSDTSVLTASAADTATSGKHSVTVTQLAKNHALRSNDNYTATTNTLNTGTLSIAIGSGTPKEITIDATNNTLAGIRNTINDADAGVTASIVNDGSYQRLVLGSNTTGSAGAITVAVIDSGSGGSFALSGLASASLVQTQAADDAQLTIDGLSITRSSNTISDAIDGLTLTLAKAGSATATVAQNTGNITSAMNSFVKAYNDAVKLIRSASAYDAATKTAATLTGDSTARSILARLNSLVHSSVSGIAGDISRLSDLGVSVQKDGTLVLDSSKLSAALADAGKDVASLFSQTTSGNQGIAVRFGAALKAMVENDGLIDSRTEGIEASIKRIAAQRDAFENRLTAIEKRYRTQFSALDSLVASMNRTSSYLAQQLANLPNSSN
jgi:flagellar hook-associated protein 2